MTDTVNLGIKFLETIGAALKFKKGNTLIIGDDHTPMIKSMRSLLEQPALEETEENPDDEDLDSNDNEDFRDDGHGEENDDISLDDILDKDEEMNRHAKDLAFLGWFSKELQPKKHKKQNKPISPLILNLINEVKEKRHCIYH